MMGYYMKTNPFKAMRMIPVALGLFTHKRITVKMDKISPEGIKQLQAIIDKAESNGGAPWLAKPSLIMAKAAQKPPSSPSSSMRS